MPAFATLQEFADFMQMPITNSAATIALNAATSTIQTSTGQLFHYVEDDEITVRGSSGRVFLPQHPVVSISSVTTRWIGDAEATTRIVDVDYIRWGNELNWAVGGYVRLNASPKWGTYGFDWPEYVTVVYTHGYVTIPADVKMCCLQLAAETYTSPDGASFESIDDYRWRRGDAEDSAASQALKRLVRKYALRAQMVGLR